MSARKSKARPKGRRLKQRLTSAKGRKLSSTLWLERQINDPYAISARAEGYRSRAAYKLMQLDERFGLLAQANAVVDLGAAPGGWSQVAASNERVKRVIAVDLADMDPIPGVQFIRGDIMEHGIRECVRDQLGEECGLVLSDMAAPATGHRSTDHVRTLALAETAFEFATIVLDQGGSLVVKVMRGGADNTLLSALKTCFQRTVHAKPPASRQESREIYLVALGYRG